MAKVVLTHELARKAITYNPDNGLFYRNSTGQPTGYLNKKNRYVYVWAVDKLYLAHRLAFFLQTEQWPINDVDHINGIRNDNRWVNLRNATRSQNLMNKASSNVQLREGGYRVKLKVEGKNIHGGYYKTKEEAEEKAKLLKQQYHKEFAC